MQGIISIILILILLLLAAGLYLIFTSRAAGGLASGNETGVRIIGSEGSIVSVRKVASSGEYEIRVQELPVIDSYKLGAFTDYDECLYDRWTDPDISDEKRALLYDEIRDLYGVEMDWEPFRKHTPGTPEAKPEAGKEMTDGVSKEGEDDGVTAGKEPQAPGKVNSFNGYDPFLDIKDSPEDAAQAEDKGKDSLLLEFIVHSFRKGLIKEELAAYAAKRYGGGDGAEDLMILLREKNVSEDADVSSDIKEMNDDEFLAFVHEQVSEAAVDRVVEEVTGEEDTHAEDGQDGEETDADGQVSADEQETSAASVAEHIRPAGYDWGDSMDE